jgi:hypothetical protein
MSATDDGQPAQFLTVAFGTPIDIGFLQQEADGPEGTDLTVAFQAKQGTSFLPYGVTQTAPDTSS